MPSVAQKRLHNDCRACKSFPIADYHCFLNQQVRVPGPTDISRKFAYIYEQCYIPRACRPDIISVPDPCLRIMVGNSSAQNRRSS